MPMKKNWPGIGPKLSEQNGNKIRYIEKTLQNNFWVALKKGDLNSCLNLLTLILLISPQLSTWLNSLRNKERPFQSRRKPKQKNRGRNRLSFLDMRSLMVKL